MSKAKRSSLLRPYVNGATRSQWLPPRLEASASAEPMPVTSGMWPEASMSGIRPEPPQPGDWRERELSLATSLDDLKNAILGDTPRASDDRDRLTEAVNAQVRSLRDELGIPEPVVARPVEPPVAARVVRAGPNAERAIFSIPLATPWNQAPSLPVSVMKRVPVWITQLTGIARRRMP